MWDIKNEVTRWMLEWQIVTEAAERKDVRSDTIALSKQIILHLIKIYKFHNPIDLHHHCKDMDVWITKISLRKIKGGKKPTFKDYYEWMYEEHNVTSEYVGTVVNGLNDYTKNLKAIRSDKDVMDIIKTIMYHIALDLSTGNVKNMEIYVEKNPPYDNTLIDVGDDEDYDEENYEYNYDDELYRRMGW